MSKAGGDAPLWQKSGAYRQAVDSKSLKKVAITVLQYRYARFMETVLVTLCYHGSMFAPRLPMDRRKGCDGPC